MVTIFIVQEVLDILSGMNFHDRDNSDAHNKTTTI